MAPFLFVDRDGTIIDEPQPSQQVDSFEKLSFLPGVISALSRIQNELGYQLVMVTNQDGLGTASFPEDQFSGPHDLMMRTLQGEGVVFSEVLIDRSFPEDNAATRKPRIGLVEKYLMHPDLPASFMVGDRPSDLEFAKNLGIGAIYLGSGCEGGKLPEAVLSFASWSEIYRYLANKDRVTSYRRKTNETEVDIQLNLDGTGLSTIRTGLSFLDHMLEQIAKHGAIDLDLICKGDLEVDEHHSVEDVALSLGEAIREALGDKRGIERYGFVLPMDEAKAEVVIDFSGRPYLKWDVVFTRERVGDVPTEMFHHFFHSFAQASGATLHITASGENDHHLIEGIFKAMAKSLRAAVRREENASYIPSTKGII